jgi:hypothetical protein
LRNYSVKKDKPNTPSKQDPTKSNLIKGKDFGQLEELTMKLDTLIDLLSEKGIITKKQFDNNIMMRMHESSKARGFDDFTEEI